MGFVSKIKEGFNKNKTLFLSIFIFLLIFCTLGLPYIKWGFFTDDFGNVFHSRINNIRDFLNLFQGKCASFFVYDSSNYKHPIPTSFSALYRPLSFVFYGFQYLLWGFRAYYYFLVNIFLHALSTVLIFNIFLIFLDYTFAFWGALFFAFHSSLFFWLGWVASQPYNLGMLLFLLLFLFFIKYLFTSNIKYYFLSCVLFLIILFLRETYIFLPFLIFLYFLVFENIFNFKNILVCTGFLGISIINFFLRLTLFPAGIFVTANKIDIVGMGISFEKFDFISKIKFYYPHVSSLLNDAFCLYFLPAQKYTIIKIFIILLIIFFLLYLFFKSKKKKLIIFLFLGMIFFMWPIFLRYYVSRYFYEPLFFFTFILFVLIKSIQNIKLNFLILYFVILLVFTNAFVFMKVLKQRENFTYNINLSFDELSKNSKIQKKSICFVGLPGAIFYSGLGSALWMRGYNLDNKVFLDRSTSPVYNKDLNENLLNINLTKNGFRLKTLNKDIVWISEWVPEETCMGRRVITKIIKNKILEVEYILDKKYLDRNLMFITWDYKNSKFKILE